MNMLGKKVCVLLGFVRVYFYHFISEQEDERNLKRRLRTNFSELQSQLLEEAFQVRKKKFAKNRANSQKNSDYDSHSFRNRTIQTRIESEKCRFS